MDPKHWPELKDALQRALVVATAQRPDLLDSICNDNEELRRELERILAAHSGEASFLERSALQVPMQIFEPGERIDHYRIERKLEGGGMATVYLATDLKHQRPAAIKVMGVFHLAPETRRWFRQEALALGRLQHPHIATLFGSGVTPDGRSYLAMEYVEGSSLVDYCKSKNLSLRRRLEIFRKICLAVGAAHRRFLVHRDLKPSNIIVGEVDEPRLLDFGIASLLDPSSLLPLGHTAIERRPMTLPYASPEQVSGEIVQIGSDIYSLGVILFELLTGRLPYSAEIGDRTSLRHAILYENPPRPSVLGRQQTFDTSGPPQSRSDGVTRELDSIVLMALRKDVHERYTSAEGLAQDIENYLANRPVSAVSSSRFYRGRKFLRRNWSWMLAVVLLGASLVVGLILLTVQYKETLRQRDLATAQALRANLEAKAAEATADFLASLFELSDPSETRGEEVSASILLDRGAEKLGRQSSSLSPELNARLQGTIGVVYTNLGLYDRAEPLLLEALETIESLATEPSPALRKALLDLGHFALSTQNAERALTYYSRALSVSRSIWGEEHEFTAECTGFVGWTLLHLSRREEAEKMLRQALETRRALLTNDDPALARSLHDLAVLLLNSGRPSEALPLLEEALDIQQAAFGKIHPDVAMTLNNLSLALVLSGIDENTEELLEESLDVHRRLFGPNHQTVAMNLHNLAMIQMRNGRPEESEANMRESLRISMETLGADNLNTAGALQGLSTVLERQGRCEEGIEHAEQALEIAERLAPPGSLPIALIENVLGGCMVVADRLEEAEVFLAQSHPVIVAARGADSPAGQESARRREALRTALRSRVNGDQSP